MSVVSLKGQRHKAPGGGGGGGYGGPCSRGILSLESLKFLTFLTTLEDSCMKSHFLSMHPCGKPDSADLDLFINRATTWCSSPKCPEPNLPSLINIQKKKLS